MTIAKQERHEQETAIHQLRNDAGLQALRSWLYDRQAEVNRRWPDMRDEELSQAQGEARLLRQLIKMVDQGPTIKQGGV